MATNISTVYGTTAYEVGIPDLTDNVNIQRAFADYHYGAGNNGSSSTTTGVNYHLGQLDTLKASLSGATFTGAVSGPEPVASNNLATKNYVDSSAGFVSTFLLGGM